jgi:hypothetical protein
MSTLAESGVAEEKNGDRRMSLGKYVKRMSSVFKREKSSKSSGGTTPVVPPVAEAEQHGTKTEAINEESASASYVDTLDRNHGHAHDRYSLC